jgi:hypothetical protein
LDSERIIHDARDGLARTAKEPTMTTNFSAPPEFSGTATIYKFPPRGRYALRIQDGDAALAANAPMPRGVKLITGSGWYHDDAIQAEKNRKK